MGGNLDAQLYRNMENMAGLVWVAQCLEMSEIEHDTQTGNFADFLGLSKQLVDPRLQLFELRLIFSFEIRFTLFSDFVVL